jgi:hypothetical protein
MAQKQNDTTTYAAVFGVLLITVGAQLFTEQSTSGRVLTAISVFIIAVCMGITIARSKKP